MWIVLTLSCAFVQALWMALSKDRLQTLTPLRFMLFFRFPVVVVMAPALFLDIGRAHRVPVAGERGTAESSQRKDRLPAQDVSKERAGPSRPVEPSARLLRLPGQLELRSAEALPRVPPTFWGIVLFGAVVECVRLLSFAYGSRSDYYATYSLKNMAPVFVLLLAPHVLGEKLTAPVVCGVLSVVAGGLVFYRAGRFSAAGLLAAVSQGALTIVCRLGMSLSRPMHFMVLIYALSTAILFGIESARSGLRSTVRAFLSEAKRTLPLSALNVLALLTYAFGLDAAPGATPFSILFRTSLIFGFVLSLVLLKEYDGWRVKLVGATCILVGCVLIA